MVAAPLADAQPQRCDFFAVHIDSRRIAAGFGLDAVLGECVDDGVFQTGYQAADADAEPVEVEQSVGNKLAGSVVSDLAAAVGFD